MSETTQEQDHFLTFGWAFDFSYQVGSQQIKITKGRAKIAASQYSPELIQNIKDNFGDNFTDEVYDPTNPAHSIASPLGNGSFGSDRQQVIMQGPVTVNSFNSPNPAVNELDSQLAQALATGSVDSLVAENPGVLEGAGFVANTGTPAPTAPAGIKVPKAK